MEKIIFAGLRCAALVMVPIAARVPSVCTLLSQTRIDQVSFSYADSALVTEIVTKHCM